MTAHRIVSDSAPMAGRAPLQPMDASHKRGTIRLALLLAGLFVAVVLAVAAAEGIWRGAGL